MADPGLYSRLVVILKVGLPLVALGLLSALFLIQTDERLGGEISFSEGDLEDLGSGLRVTNPTFTGTSQSGDRFRFTAELVVPDAAPPTRADITGLKGRIDFADGTRVEVSSNTARLSISEQVLELDSAVRVRASQGLRVLAGAMTLHLAAGTLEAHGGVKTEGPMGAIDSDTLRIAPSGTAGAGDAARLISFGNGVRLVYHPTATPE